MPQFTYARAQVEARILSQSAKLTDLQTPDGSEIWRSTDGEPIAFVVKRDRGLRICVTVLPRASDKSGHSSW